MKIHRIFVPGFFIAFFLVRICDAEIPSKYFPEELQRGWDLACADWPQEVMGGQVAHSTPLIRAEKAKGYFRVQAHMLLSPEKGETLSQLQARTESLLADGPQYESWVLPRINKKLGGGSYFVDVLGLQATEVKDQERYVLGGPYIFKLLFFKREGFATMEFRRDSRVLPPSCPVFEGVKEIPRFVYRMTPRQDLITLMLMELYLIPNASEKNLKLQLRLVAKPAPLVYQLMPDALLRSELLARGKQIFENFSDFRRTLALSKSEAVSLKPPPKAQNLNRVR